MKFRKTLTTLMTISYLACAGCDAGHKQDVSNQDITVIESVEAGNTRKDSTQEDLTVYTVATVSTYPPFATKNENGTITGFDIDVLDAIGEIENFTPQFVVRSWDGWKTDLEQETVHIWAAGIAEKEERKEYVDFTDSYLQYDTSLLTLADDTYSNLNKETIAKLKLGAAIDTTDFELIQSLVADKANAKEFESTYVAFESLLQKDIDGVVGNKLVLAGIAQQYSEFSFQFNQLKEYDSDDHHLAFMIRKSDTELQKKINNGLKTIQDNGKLDEIKAKWFGDLLE